MSGESRVDLLSWVNGLLNLNYSKVEQLGSGAAYCQIIDSIFLDVPMARVKFDTSKEYDHLNNFKVLQSSFVKHKVSKNIPVDKLIKCKFQDNLEFFQWIRKFWLENKDESEYEPMSRRKYLPPAASTPGSRTPAPRSLSNGSNSGIRSSSSTNGTAARRATSNSSVSSNPTSSTLQRTRLSNGAPANTSRTTSRVSSLTHQNSAANKELEHELSSTKSQLEEVSIELEEYRSAVEALETERNFYFNKLREIEILTETTNDLLKTNGETDDLNLKDVLIKVQEILYNTEEGFQVPDELEGNDVNMEEETF